MSSAKKEARCRSASRIVSTTGRLHSKHFLLVADHLMLEVRPSDFQLMGAIAEGNVEVHMLGGGEGTEYVVFANSGVFQADRQRLVLHGWNGTRESGVNHPPTAFRREVVIRTDGTFFHTASDIDAGLMAESETPALQAA